MNRKRKSSNNRIIHKNKEIIRCKNKMIPVFKSDTCENFIKKENSESNNICMNCKHSF